MKLTIYNVVLLHNNEQIEFVNSNIYRTIKTQRKIYYLTKNEVLIYKR